MRMERPLYKRENDVYFHVRDDNFLKRLFGIFQWHEELLYK